MKDALCIGGGHSHHQFGGFSRYNFYSVHSVFIATAHS